MTQTTNNLRFRETAQNALAFLVNDYSFSCASASDFHVRYESNKVYIEILHGLQDCEVHIVFGRLETKERYSFELFLQLINPTFEKSLGDRMATTPELVAATVSAVVNALQSEGQPIIEGDDKVFERMKEVRWWHFCPEVLE